MRSTLVVSRHDRPRLVFATTPKVAVEELVEGA
jgi:hypothetical protein